METIFCPFCGASAWKMLHQNINDTELSFVSCINPECNATGPKRDSTEAALKCWGETADAVLSQEIREGGKF